MPHSDSKGRCDLSPQTEPKMIKCVFAVCDVNLQTLHNNFSNVRVVVNDASVNDGSLAIEIALPEVRLTHFSLRRKQKSVSFYERDVNAKFCHDRYATEASYKENEHGVLDLSVTHTTTTMSHLRYTTSASRERSCHGSFCCKKRLSQQ
jgi:hypothetical protein